MQPKVKIGIVGTGISGSSAAFILGEFGHNFEISVFDLSDTVAGMHNHSIDVPKSSSQLPVPPRSFSPMYYKNLMKLYEYASVPVAKFDGSFAFAVGRNSSFHKTHWHLFGNSLPSLFDSEGNFRLFDSHFYKVHLDAASFFYDIQFNPIPKDLTLGDYLKQKGYSKEFIYHILLPVLVMVCTCSYSSMLEYPMHLVANFLLVSDHNKMFQTKNGTREAAEKLLKHVAKNYTGTSVQRVVRGSASSLAKIFFKSGESSEVQELEFDHIILTCPANISSKILENPSIEDTNILSSFKYEISNVVVHSDPNLMPALKTDWAGMNFIISEDSKSSMTTMHAVSSKKVNIFQTWNPIMKPRPEYLIQSVDFGRSVVNQNSIKAVSKLKLIQGKGNIWFAGAYAEEMIPLQESGVVSAIRVCRYLGVEVPWIQGTYDSCSLNAVSNNMDQLYSLDHSFRKILGESMNLGFWKANETTTINDAHKNLVRYVGNNLNLNEEDRIICVGVGCGNEVITFANSFGCKLIHGVEPVLSQLNTARKKTQFLHGSDVSILYGEACDLPFATEKYTKIVSIDSAYHFKSRLNFFNEAYRVLVSGGCIGLSDLTFDWNKIPLFGPYFGSYIISYCGIPLENQVNIFAYKQSLTRVGFKNIVCRDISNNVFDGFCRFAGSKGEKMTWLAWFTDWFPILCFAWMLKTLNFIGVLQCVVVTAEK